MEKHLRCSTLMAGVAVLLAAFCAMIHAQTASASSQTAQASSVKGAIPASQLLQPKELEELLRSSSAKKPMILQVGSHVLYPRVAYSRIGVRRGGRTGGWTAGASASSEGIEAGCLSCYLLRMPSVG